MITEEFHGFIVQKGFRRAFENVIQWLLTSEEQESDVQFDITCMIEREGCKTVCCIAGKMYFDKYGFDPENPVHWWDIQANVREDLLCEDCEDEIMMQLNDLFMGPICTNKEAADVIQRFLDTGKVVWHKES